jgi:type IV secretion system protein VirB5
MRSWRAASVQANAVLTPAQLALLSPDEQALVRADRQRTALASSMSREALASASARFDSLQTLINAIGTATDPKGIADLQVRVSSEQTMVTNESIKLRVLAQVLSAAAAQEAQRSRELAISDVGSLRALPPLGLVP